MGETKVLGPDLIHDSLEKVILIRERLVAAQNKQKAYVDHRQHDLEFAIRNIYMVFLKVSPMKGCMRFEKKRKLSSRYIGAYEILERIGNVAYRVALPADLEGVHPIFHVSMLRKYLYDPSHVIQP